jgi:hypothetical protein
MLKVFFVALIFSLVIFPVLANESVETDQGSISLRKFDNEKVNKYRSNADFQYKAVKQEGITWWDRVKYAIMQFIARLLSLATNTFLGRIIFYTLCISLLL